MRESFETGFSFGLTSGVITTLGLFVGLHSVTHSTLAVIGGVLTIAIADAFSDALGIHISEESKNQYSSRQIWEATLSTFISKAVFALTFVVPILFLDLQTATIVAVIWGLALVSLLSYRLAKKTGVRPAKVISEHLMIAIVVIAIAHLAGDWIAARFGQTSSGLIQNDSLQSLEAVRLMAHGIHP
jgi:vacuolar iron transporter family protein